MRLCGVLGLELQPFNTSKIARLKSLVAMFFYKSKTSVVRTGCYKLFDNSLQATDVKKLTACQEVGNK